MDKKEQAKSIPQPAQNATGFHKMTEVTPTKQSPLVLAIFVGVIILGLISGYFLSRKTLAVSTNSSSSTNSSGNIKQINKGDTYGSTDTKTFKDTVDGIMKKGGIGDEGQYHLVRPGGDSQNVYLTSSTVDLSLFIDRKVKVWGQTQKAQKAGWLMDVGRVEVEN